MNIADELILFYPILICIAGALLLAIHEEVVEWKERRKKRLHDLYVRELSQMIASRCRTKSESRYQLDRLYKDGSVARLKKKYNQ